MSGFTHPTPEELHSLDNKGVHQFSLGVLDGYFHLDKLFREYKIFKFEGIVLIEAIKPFMLVYFCKNTPGEISLIQSMRKKVKIYSIDKLSFLPLAQKVSECTYNFDDVLNKNNYKSAKKRYQHLVYPFKFLEKLQFSIEKISTENINEVSKIHDEWVKHKLLDESVFKMMFSKVRYKRCCTRLLEESVLNYNYCGLVLKLENKIIGARVFSLKDNIAYDLAHFVEFWNLPSNISNYIQVWVIKYLQSIGITHINCGLYLNKKLSVFKHSLPNFETIYYAYGKEKNESISSTVRGPGLHHGAILGLE